MTPNDKMLAAVFGHTQASAAYIAAEVEVKLAQAWVRASEMVAAASADPWAGALGSWEPVMYWAMPAAYCAETAKVVCWKSGTQSLEVYGLAPADVEEITKP
jgi:hypothetical protein